jgi:isoleucyl-tRNA synthetase
VFVKFPLADRPGENLLVWTTTPWTLTSNVAAAVNPELTYVKVKLKHEVFYVAKGAFKCNRMESSGDDEVNRDAESSERSGRKPKRDWLDGVPHLSTIEQMFKSKAGKEGYEIVGEVQGSEMLGWEYAGPFDDSPAQNHNDGFPADVARVVHDRCWAGGKPANQLHRIIAWKDVGETEGTGIVHIAPGCGAEDFGLGKENKLAFVAPLDESGNFHYGFGSLSGKTAYDPDTAEVVFEELKKKDRLFTTERYVHKYPHCWRCKTELLFRLVDEWFIHMGPRETEQGFRGEIMKIVDQVTFLPESINGRARECDWLRNMGDWMISKKRFWGLALPIWVDEKTGDFEVIGSKEELKQRAVEGWDEFEGNSPHRPFVDRVKIRNPKTGNLMSRIPDVGNPWLDAGIVAFSTLKWNADPAYWRKWYPADFITESFPGQFRNWFYALLALSTMMGDGEPAFKTLLGHGLVRDEHGHEMHKSAGNSIEFNKAADEMGADVMRWLYCRHDPAKNLNFGYGPANEVRAKFHIKLWNCYAFFCNYARLDGFDPSTPQVPVAERSDIDRWILSDLQLLIKAARENFEAYDVMRFCLEVESFVDDRLSNWYVRRNRRRFWSKNSELDAAGSKDKLAAYQSLHEVLKTLCRLCAPVVPFACEVIWKNLTDGSAGSVHVQAFPVSDAGRIDSVLSEDMSALLRLISLGGAARNVAKVKTRQPLAELVVQPGNEAEGRAVDRFAEQITEELNVKAVRLHSGKSPLLSATARLNKKTAAAKLGPKLREAEVELAKLDPTAIRSRVVLAGIELDAADLLLEFAAPVGFAGVADKGTQVMLDTRITPELKSVGLSRDVIRFVQDARKDAGLDVADKIVLYLGTESVELNRAIETHWATIAAEVQAVERLGNPPAGGYAVEVKVDGQKLWIGLRKT